MYKNTPKYQISHSHVKQCKKFSLSVNTARKVSKYGVISGPHFPVFGLNTERYSVSLRIQSEYRNIRLPFHAASVSAKVTVSLTYIFKL